MEGLPGQGFPLSVALVPAWEPPSTLACLPLAGLPFRVPWFPCCPAATALEGARALSWAAQLEGIQGQS